MRTLVFCSVIFMSLSSQSLPVNAQAPRAMSFQGLLTDTAGVPVDGPQNLTIRIFDASSGGSEVWNRTYGSHPVNEGVFDVELDGGAPMFDLVAFNNSLWIQVEAGAEVLSPRTRLVAAPFAMGLSLPIEANVAATIAALKIVNTTASGVTTGVYGQTSSTSVVQQRQTLRLNLAEPIFMIFVSQVRRSRGRGRDRSRGRTPNRAGHPI